MWNIIYIKTLYHPTCIESCVHLYLTSAVLNWLRASKTAIQPLENLQNGFTAEYEQPKHDLTWQNKVVKFRKTSNIATLGGMYINLQSSHFNQYFKFNQQFIITTPDLQLQNISYYPG